MATPESIKVVVSDPIFPVQVKVEVVVVQVRSLFSPKEQETNPIQVQELITNFPVVKVFRTQGLPTNLEGSKHRGMQALDGAPSTP